MTSKKDLKKKDEILIKDSALAVADIVVDEIAKNLPGINIAWGLAKAVSGAALKLRHEKALEWVEMVRDTPTVLTEEILNDKAFQDGFAVGIEKYLIERNSNKRIIFRNIFLGFTEAKEKQDYSLEKYIHTLSQLTEVDIGVLRDLKITKKDKNYQIYGDNDFLKENIHNLINSGILFDTTGTRIGYDGANSPFVEISNFGIAFREFLAE